MVRKMTKNEMKSLIIETVQEMGIDELLRVTASCFSDALEEARQDAAQKRRTLRIKNTKLLLKNYQELMLQAQESIGEMDYNYWMDLMLPDGKISLDSIRRSIAKTRALCMHVQVMLDEYRKKCEQGSSSAQMRWRIISSYYLDAPKLSAPEIAEKEYVDVGNVYAQIEKGCDELGVYLFGIDALEQLFFINEIC